MGRTEQRADVLLNAEDRMPGKITCPGGQEEHYPGRCRPVTGGHRFRPPRTGGAPAPGQCGDPEGTRREARVQDRVPRREERLQVAEVVVRPAVNIGSREEPDAGREGDGIFSGRSGAVDGNRRNCKGGGCSGIHSSTVDPTAARGEGVPRTFSCPSAVGQAENAFLRQYGGAAGFVCRPYRLLRFGGRGGKQLAGT